MKSFCPYDLSSHLSVLTIFPPHWVATQRVLDAFVFFSNDIQDDSAESRRVAASVAAAR